MLDTLTRPAAVSAVPASTPWWRGAAIYQVWPRSFADSDGDGVGDLPGVTARLDHIARLGVDAVWLSPFFASPQDDFGYDVSDYRAVDPLFGTLADFDALVARAHALGLRVLIDQVYSHTSDRHAWFAASRSTRTGVYSDWYVWADPRRDGSPPSNWQSVFGGPAWTWDARRRQYYFHNFLSSQPQLNVHLPAVQDELLATARFWLDRGVDGFRVDAINFAMHDPLLRDNPPAPDDGRPRTRPFDYQLKLHNQSHPDIPRFLERLRGVLDGYPDRFMVAEVGGDDNLREMRLFTEGGHRCHSAYGFEFLYAPRLTPALVAEALTSWPDAPGHGWPSWAFENHDSARALTRWADPAHAAPAARMKALLLACLRGNIFLYQGEELGLGQVDLAFEDLKDPEAITNWPLTLGRDGARTPMPWTAEAPALGFTRGRPWLPLGPEHARLAANVQEADRGSILHATRAALALRRAHPALRLGAAQIVHCDDALIGFTRTHAGERLLCLFNLAAEPRALPPGVRASAVIAAVNGAGTALPPYGALVVDIGESS